MKLAATAVLAIDLQNEYRTAAAYPVEGYDQILANAASIMGAARAANIPVIHMQAWVEDEQRSDYRLLHDGLPDGLESAVAGSEGAAICAEAGPLSDEVVIRKPWPSAFRDTKLEDILHRWGVEHLLVIGVWTDSCVRASVFDAVLAGFRVWLVKDACGSGTGMMHRTAILDMANRLYGGGVMCTERAVGALGGQPSGAWQCSRPVEFQYRLETIDPLYEAL